MGISIPPVLLGQKKKIRGGEKEEEEEGWKFTMEDNTISFNQSQPV